MTFKKMMKTNSQRYLFLNMLSSICFQVTTITCGFILPRYILRYYGSQVNGIVNSVSQFLSVISFLELGIGAVVQSALYKPLAYRDSDSTSKIIVSATKFFHRLCCIFLVYIAVLIYLFPRIASQKVDWSYSAALIIAMSISSLAQYYYGIVDRLLLTADQKGYIQYTAQTVTLILNVFACVYLIQAGASIHVVKLTTSLIYLARPIFLRVYVNHHYQLDRHIQYTDEPIQQKWNGIAQHVAAIVLDGTDIIVLTLFASFSDVSIYSVYYLIVSGIKQILLSLTNGMHALIGNLWAKQQLSELKKTFSWFEWAMHNGTTFAFGCASVLILPFVNIYTKDVHDISYIRPYFSILIILAYAFFSYRNPYIILILAAGHFKQTQHNYIIAAVMNIVISVAVVSRWGLVGVAIGTLAAMAYQTVWMAFYNSRNLLCWPFKNFCKQLLADSLTVLFAVPVCRLFSLTAENYLQWVLLAIPVALVWLLSAFIVNFILYRDKLLSLLGRFRRILPISH